MFNQYEFKQYLATFFVDIIAIAYGTTVGWPSSSIPILQSPIDYPLKTGPITIAESSWVGSIMCIGGLCGTLLFGFLANWLGRKVSLCILAFPQLVSCLLLLCTQNIYYLLASRFLGGLVGGGAFVVVPLYIAEISDDKIRGSLGSKLVLFCNVGILLSFIIGDYSIVPIVLAVLPLLFFAGVFFLPETPFFLIKSNKEMEAEYSWRFFHGLKRDSLHMTSELKINLDKVKSFNNDETYEDKVEWKDLLTPVAKRAFFISIGLVSLNQLCGIFAMLTYTASIFKESGADLTPNLAAIIVGIIQLVGSYVSTVLVDKAGRKILLIISSLGSSLGLSAMGIHGYLKVNNYDVSSFGWVPIASFSFVIFIASWGVLTLPFVVMAEVMPEKIRATASSICMSFLWIIAFLEIKYFSLLTEILAMHGSMFLFSSFSFAGTIFVIFVVPETKGKSFNEILKILQKQ